MFSLLAINSFLWAEYPWCSTVQYIFTAWRKVQQTDMKKHLLTSSVAGTEASRSCLNSCLPSTFLKLSCLMLVSPLFLTGFLLLSLSLSTMLLLPSSFAPYCLMGVASPRVFHLPLFFTMCAGIRLPNAIPEPARRTPAMGLPITCPLCSLLLTRDPLCLLPIGLALLMRVVGGANLLESVVPVGVGARSACQRLLAGTGECFKDIQGDELAPFQSRNT